MVHTGGQNLNFKLYLLVNELHLLHIVYIHYMQNPSVCGTDGVYPAMASVSRAIRQGAKGHSQHTRRHQKPGLE